MVSIIISRSYIFQLIDKISVNINPINKSIYVIKNDWIDDRSTFSDKIRNPIVTTIYMKIIKELKKDIIVPFY